MNGLDPGAVAARRLAAVIALAVCVAMLVAGLLVGLLPIHVAGIRCGNALGGGTSILSEGICDEARSARLVPAVVLMVIGGLGTLVSAGLCYRFSPDWRDRIARERAQVEEMRRRGLIE